MGALIPIIEEYGPELEEGAAAEINAAAAYVETEAPVVETELESAAKAIADKATEIGQSAESEGKAVLDDLKQLFSDADTCETTSACPLATESGTQDVWELSPFERGREIEEALGNNLPSNYPVIDKFEDGVATSIKSVDLEAPSYQSASTLSRTLTSYVDKLSDFSGRNWAGVNIKGSEITSRVLDVAVSPGATLEQQNVLNSTVQYGASEGVTVNVIVFP